MIPWFPSAYSAALIATLFLKGPLILTSMYSGCWWRYANAFCSLHISTLRELCSPGSPSLCQEISWGCTSLCKGPTANRHTVPQYYAVQHNPPDNPCACWWSGCRQACIPSCQLCEHKSYTKTMVDGQAPYPVLHQWSQSTRSPVISFLSRGLAWNLSKDSKSTY